MLLVNFSQSILQSLSNVYSVRKKKKRKEEGSEEIVGFPHLSAKSLILMTAKWCYQRKYTRKRCKISISFFLFFATEFFRYRMFLIFPLGNFSVTNKSHVELNTTQHSTQHINALSLFNYIQTYLIILLYQQITLFKM